MNSQKYLLRELPLRGDVPITTSIYDSNRLRLSKHSFLVTLLRLIFEQFKRLSNLWFLIVSFIQIITLRANPTNSWTTITPLLVLILFSLSQDLYDSYLLWKNLKLQNERTYLVWNGNDFEKTKSQDIFVGHIITLEMNEIVPADIIMLTRYNTEHSIFLNMTNLLGFNTCVKKIGFEEIENEIANRNWKQNLYNLE